MHEVISNPEQLTPELLTRILCIKGFLGTCKDNSVQEVKCSRKISTWFANIYFLDVDFPGKVPESAPKRLFLKTSRADLELADLIYGKKEVEFYNTIANVMESPSLPRCLDAIYDPVTGKSHVLLEDLSETHYQPKPPLPPSNSDCELVMNCLARFHAYWWEHPQLMNYIEKVPSPESSGFYLSLQETEEAFASFIDFLGDRLSTERCRIFEKVLSSWPFSQLSERLNEKRDITLIHNDAHAWNFLYPREPEVDRVCIIDWHEWGSNLGTNDLTELMVLWWYPERRARMEERLLRLYHYHLKKFGVEGYDWEQCWNDYRLSVIRILLYPVWMFAENRSPSNWWPILERTMLAFQDLDCETLLV